VANTVELFRNFANPLAKNPGVGFIDLVRCSTLYYGRGAGVGRTLGVGSHLPVHGVGVGVGVGVAVAVAVGVKVAVAVGVGLGVPT